MPTKCPGPGLRMPVWVTWLNEMPHVLLGRKNNPTTSYSALVRGWGEPPIYFQPTGKADSSRRPHHETVVYLSGWLVPSRVPLPSSKHPRPQTRKPRPGQAKWHVRDAEAASGRAGA